VARKRVENAVKTITREQEAMQNAANVELATKEPEIPSKHMMIAIGEGLSNHAYFKTVEDGHDKDDEDTELGKLSEDDQPGWVVATMPITAQQRMQTYRQMWIKLDELIQPGWGYTANNFCGRNTMYGIIELMMLAVGNLQTDKVAAVPTLMRVGDLMESLDIVLGNYKCSNSLLDQEAVICGLVQVSHIQTNAYCIIHLTQSSISH